MSGDAERGARLTDRQRRATAAPGGVAIVAGAGTGKTHTLGQRYLAHLQEGLSPLSIVAVTFTERAAHELRARVRHEARATLPSDDPRLDALEAAPIGTVHALCLRICRDHPTAAGVAPDVRVLDPLEGSLWTEDRLEEALARVPERLFDVLPYERVRDVLRTMVRDPFLAERALAVPPDAWPELVSRARHEARRRLDDAPGLADARTTLEALRGPEGDAGERARRALLAAFEAADRGDAEAAASALHRVRPNVGSAKSWGERQQALRDALATSLEALRGWARDPLASLTLGPVDDLLAETLHTLRDAFEHVRGSLRDAKRRAGVLDFADLETAALRALGDDRVRRHYGLRWRALLVDEVQDTSPVQEAILDAIGSFCRTTLVGDPKQSIYGFRGADVGVFRRMTDAVVAAAGERVVLDRSFRTHAALVARLNELFAQVLGADHEPLVGHDTTVPGDAPFLRAWRFAIPPRTPAGVIRLAEAHRIADGILAALDQGVPVRENGGRRPLRPGDIAVLARTWAPLDLLAEVLPARGVPAVHTGGGDLLATREASDGVAALRVLADPHDDVALVALLRGPCFAIADDELDALVETTRPGAGDARPPSWWERLGAADRPAVVAARTCLRDLLDAARREPPSRLLQRLDRATGWSAVAANLPGGPRRRADLEGFFAFVRELERDGSDVFGAVRRLRRLQRAGVEVDRPALEAHDAVTLTTVHRSKGLEWPYVVVAALDVEGRGDRVPLRMRGDVGVALRLDTEEDRRAEPALWTVLDAAARAADDAERRRLLYVATTRAADHLVLSTGRASGAMHDVLAASLSDASVPIEVRELEPDEVAWPEPPLPGLDRTFADDGGTAAWLAESGEGGRNVDVARAADAPSAGAKTVPDDGQAWDLALERTAPVAPAAGALLDRLREAGAPPPRATTRPARDGWDAWPWTLARWSRSDGAEGEVVLVEAGIPSDAGDAEAAERVVFDASRIAEVERRLCRALGLARPLS